MPVLPYQNGATYTDEDIDLFIGDLQVFYSQVTIVLNSTPEVQFGLQSGAGSIKGYTKALAAVLSLLLVADEVQRKSSMAYLATLVAPGAISAHELWVGTDGFIKLTTSRKPVLVTAAPDIDAGLPTPTAINTDPTTDVRHIVAVEEAWRRFHKTDVHMVEARRWRTFAGRIVALGATVQDLADAAVNTVGVVVHSSIPKLRKDLTTALAKEATARTTGDRTLTKSLATTAAAIRVEVRTVAAWVATVVVPELTRAISAERVLRIKADGTLQRGIATEAQDRTAADTDLALQLAPLTEWFGAYGLLTTTKVHKMEPAFDHLLRQDLNWLSTLAIPGAFTALVGRIVGQVAGRVPETILGLEDAAVRALGAL